MDSATVAASSELPSVTRCSGPLRGSIVVSVSRVEVTGTRTVSQLGDGVLDALLRLVVQPRFEITGMATRAVGLIAGAGHGIASARSVAIGALQDRPVIADSQPTLVDVLAPSSRAVAESPLALVTQWLRASQLR
jgi:hypothetical protein